jgi:hypothetical protein
LPERPEDDDEQLGSLRPTAPVTLAAWGVAGLAIGWLVHPVTERVNDATWRSVHVRRERLEPHRAVNRLVLARACALAGALVGAGYLGYALSWLGSGAELADDRMVRSAVAAVGGLATVVTALLLERACRVRNRPDPA